MLMESYCLLVSVAEVDAELAIEGTPGFLQAEVVVKLLVGEVATFQRNVVTSVLQGIADGEVVRQLFGHTAFGRGVSQCFPIEGKFVLVETIVGHGQDIALAEEVVPGEGGIEVGKGIGLVGDALPVADAFLQGVFGAVALAVAGIDVGEGTSCVEPTSEAVAGGEIEAFGAHVAVVLVDAVGHGADGAKPALDVVFGVAVNQAALQVEAMLAELAGIAEVQVDVVAFLGFQIGLPGFHVLVAEQLVGSGQAVGFLVGEFGLQSLEDEVGARRAVAQGGGVAREVDVVAHAVVAGGDGTAVVLVVVFGKGGQVPLLGRHEAVGQAGDVLAGELGDVEVGDFRTAAHVGTGGAPEGAEHVVQREVMCLADAVGQCGGGVPVGVLRLVVLVGLFAGGAGIFAFAAPVVFPGCGVDVLRQVVVVVGGEQEVESAGEEVALGVFHRGYEGVAFAVFLPEDDVLVDAGLYFFVEVAVCEVQHQAVGPGFVHQAYFGDDGFVVEAVVEAAQAVDAAAVGGLEAVGGKFGDVVVDVVVVVRQVLEGVEFVGEAVAEGLPEVEV